MSGGAGGFGSGGSAGGAGGIGYSGTDGGGGVGAVNGGGGGGGGSAGGGDGGNGGTGRAGSASGGAGGNTAGNLNNLNGVAGGTGGGNTGGGGGGGGGANGNGAGAASLPGTDLNGGNGGNGGNGDSIGSGVGGFFGGGGGGGGAGGYGAVVTGTGASSNQDTIIGGSGGAGGNGGNNASGGSGGDGGVGVRFTTSGATLTNTGLILGGDGGAAGGVGNGATAGLGGAGVVGGDLSVTATGSIVGGMGRGGQADAVTFTGGSNALSFTSVNGSALSGGIGVSGSLVLTTPDPFANIIHDGPNGAGALIAGAGGTGTLTLTGANTYSGGTTIQGGTLALGQAGSAGTGAITFASLTGTATARLSLQLPAQPANGATFRNALTDFGARPTDALDLAGLAYTGPATGSLVEPFTRSGVTSLTITTNGRTETFTLTGTNAATYLVQSDGAGHTQVSAAPVCFTTGTRIRTSRGEVAVEDLAIGDRAVTGSGRLRPITWIGRRQLGGAGGALAFARQPVRVRAGAFGLDADSHPVPARDLCLSPGHPVLVGADADSEGGVLVPIMCLINGTTIERVAVDRVTYWHVELDRHDVLLAEGLPAESYIDLGSRPWFDGADGALYDPDMAPLGVPGRCRPVAIDGPIVEAERRRLDAVFEIRLATACAWPGAEDATRGFSVAAFP